MIYVRWRAGESRRGRTFPPLAADHPCVIDPCFACELPIGSRRSTQLVVVGPVDEASRVECDARRWFSAGAVLLHRECADFFSDADLEELAAGLEVHDDEDGELEGDL